MKITNQDKDISVDYKQLGNGETIKQIAFHDGRTVKQTMLASAATDDLVDLLTNYDFEQVNPSI